MMWKKYRKKRLMCDSVQALVMEAGCIDFVLVSVIVVSVLALSNTTVTDRVGCLPLQKGLHGKEEGVKGCSCSLHNSLKFSHGGYIYVIIRSKYMLS